VEDLSRAVDWILEQVASDAVCNPSHGDETATP
jgi:hypothetical protein